MQANVCRHSKWFTEHATPTGVSRGTKPTEARSSDTNCANFGLLRNQQPSLLVVEIEVKQVPAGDEPEEARASGGEQDVPDAVPDPLLPVGPGNEGIEYGYQSAEAGENADDLQKVQPDIAPLTEAAGVFQSLKGEH